VRRSHNPATPHISALRSFLPNRRLRRPDRPIHDASSSTTGFGKANAPARSLGSEAYDTYGASPGGKHVDQVFLCDGHAGKIPAPGFALSPYDQHPNPLANRRSLNT
jgi:hypothetical protein